MPCRRDDRDKIGMPSIGLKLPVKTSKRVTVGFDFVAVQIVSVAHSNVCPNSVIVENEFGTH
ncbi:transcription factor Dp-1 [Novosphingobium sp. PY1]|nr:transcription factor Dp-1 [Novosphingobium sp. PY1]